MIALIVKSALSMAVLLGLYHLLLEREKMHRFNRFFLLGSLVFSLVLPFITIPVYVDVADATVPAIPITAAPGTLQAASAAEEDSCLPYLAWGIYGAVGLLLLARFAYNMASFGRKAAAGSIVPHNGARLVLLEERTVPHTFMDYIFVSRMDYEKGIEEELYIHELAHVRQKHTLDILFVETLRVVFWFNPLLYLYKRAIQLNHEFLADAQVVSTSEDPVHYQQLLLEKATAGPAYALASSLNFSITKQRFTMMTKTFSKPRAILRQFAVLPVFAALMLFFCTETIAQEKPVQKTPRKTNTVAGKKDIAKKKKINRKKYPGKAAIKPATEQTAGHLRDEFTKQPEFPGGVAEFYRLFAKNFVLPESKADLTKKMYISFTVEKDGSVTDIKSLRQSDEALEAETKRVMALLPKWIPAEKEGQPVRSGYTLPITFHIVAPKAGPGLETVPDLQAPEAPEKQAAPKQR